MLGDSRARARSLNSSWRVATSERETDEAALENDAFVLKRFISTFGSPESLLKATSSFFPSNS